MLYKILGGVLVAILALAKYCFGEKEQVAPVNSTLPQTEIEATSNPVSAASAPAPQPSGDSLMSITIPHGMGPGSQLQVQAPDGNMITVTVPPGSYPGSTIQIPALAAATLPGVEGCAPYGTFAQRTIQQPNPQPQQPTTPFIMTQERLASSMSGPNPPVTRTAAKAATMNASQQRAPEMMVQHQDEDPDSLASVSTLASTIVEPTDPLPKAGPPPCATIDEFLHKANLIEYESALRAAGVVEIDDIICLEDEDLAEIGMSKVELKRCRRLLANN